MPRLDPDSLQVESFAALETMEFEGVAPASPSWVPMCTCQSCTMGVPDCETDRPELCGTQVTVAADAG